MVQTRDKIAASLVVAAMVAFGVVVAPTAIDPKASAHDAAQETIVEDGISLADTLEGASIAKSVHAVAENYIVDGTPDTVIDNGDGTETVTVKGNDAVTKVTDEGTDGLGESVEIVIAPGGTY